MKRMTYEEFRREFSNRQFNYINKDLSLKESDYIYLEKLDAINEKGLNVLALLLDNAELEPESFEGLFIKIIPFDGSFMIMPDGRVFMITNEQVPTEDIETELNSVKKSIEEIRLKWLKK